MSSEFSQFRERKKSTEVEFSRFFFLPSLPVQSASGKKTFPFFIFFLFASLAFSSALLSVNLAVGRELDASEGLHFSFDDMFSVCINALSKMECEIRFSTRWENEEFGGEFFVCSVRVLSDASNEKNSLQIGSHSF